ncbi:hypothetical protein RRG08_055642 [Elysia crispata]|uniref:Uncharacterized protein n=1 Tax=Elysia crispata TaxID=231223 RepID=A0AAE1DBL7_9GAST|nr:hypothetical protein RRG08_055642 [Elysia crispata]
MSHPPFQLVWTKHEVEKRLGKDLFTDRLALNYERRLTIFPPGDRCRCQTEQDSREHSAHCTPLEVEPTSQDIRSTRLRPVAERTATSSSSSPPSVMPD